MAFRSIVRRLMLSTLLLGTVTIAAAQRIDGQLYSQVYGLENRSEEQQWDFYQGLNVRFRPAEVAGLALKTHLRFARRGDPADWDEKIYNAFAEYRRPGDQISFRAGRQFMYRGVISGSIDALTVEAFPNQDLSLMVVGGFASPYDKSLDVQSWDDGGVLGAYGQYRISPTARASASYFSRRSGGEVAWHQLGGALNGAIIPGLFYLAQLDYNLEASTYQSMRYRLMYAPDRWTLLGEFTSQKPRVYEDSFFNIFELESFNQLRAGTSYRTDSYEAGIQLVHTMFAEDESADELFATFAIGPGSVGVVYKTGYGGDNVGLFGDVEFDLTEELSARLRSSYYSYTRRSVSFDEDATAFSGGIRYRPVPSILLQAELQESMNTAYDNDLRVLIRAAYLLGNR